MKLPKLFKQPTKVITRIRNAVNHYNDRAARVNREPSSLAKADLIRYLQTSGESTDLISTALNILEREIVGTGITPQPVIRDTLGNRVTELENALIELYKRTYRSNGRSDVKKQKLAARTWLRDGEVFLVYEGNDYQVFDGLSVPFTTDKSRNIFDGIEFSSTGAIEAFYLRENELSDSLATASRIDATNVIYLTHLTRTRQVRGESMFKPILGRINDLNDYDSSERIASKIAASAVFFMKRGIGDSEVFDEQYRNEDVKFEPGLMLETIDGETEIEPFTPTRPNHAYMDYRNSQLGALAAQTGIDINALRGEPRGTYSSARQSMIMADANYEALFTEFTESAERRKWQSFLMDAMQRGLVISPRFIDATTLYDVEFTMQAKAWIDPQREANSLEKLIAAGLLSRTQAIRERGYNPATMLAELKQENESLQEAANQ